MSPRPPCKQSASPGQPFQPQRRRWLPAMLLLWLMVAAEALAAEPVVYRLKWLQNSSTVGDLYADVHGYFAAQGLTVEVRAGGPERDAIKELELGHAQFGVASADQVIRAAAKGAPVVVIAQIFQVNPLQWIYRASRPPIEDPADLAGLTIGITYGGNDETIMRTLLAKADLDERDVSLTSVRYDFTPFYRGRADLWPIYRNSQGIVIAERMTRAGEPVRFFNPADFGVRFVANSVVTHQRVMDTRPDLVARFRRALLQGWQAALDERNEARALETIARFDPDTPPDLMLRQLRVTRELVRPTADFAVGRLDVEAWRQTEDIMRAQGLIPAAVDVVSRLHGPEAP
ncbi:MAG: ABC transporter substrate-binding protein [Desulfobacteraceae bacterium]|nr:ABC transporter substrate-binding protein [Desulfobacteraceae bacterium]